MRKTSFRWAVTPKVWTGPERIIPKITALPRLRKAGGAVFFCRAFSSRGRNPTLTGRSLSTVMWKNRNRPNTDRCPAGYDTRTNGLPRNSIRVAVEQRIETQHHKQDLEIER